MIRCLASNQPRRDVLVVHDNVTSGMHSVSRLVVNFRGVAVLQICC